MGSTVLRALIAVVAGVLMVVYREEMVKWLTILVGILFFLSGLMSILYYYVMRRKYNNERLVAETGGGKPALHKPSAPVAGVGCALLGIILALLPGAVANTLVYVFALIIILGAIGEFVALISAHSAISDFRKAGGETKELRIDYAYYVLPSLLLIFAIVAIIRPDVIVSAPLLFIGVAFIVYGLSEIIGLIKTAAVRRHIARDTAAVVVAGNISEAVEDAEIVPETDEPVGEPVSGEDE